MIAARAVLAVGLAGLLLSACGGSRRERRQLHGGSRSTGAIVGAVDPQAANWVSFNIGLSTDPHGTSHPEGFGVATGMLSGRLRTTEDRNRQLLVEQWLGDRKLFVAAAFANSGSTMIFRLRAGRLARPQTTPARQIGEGGLAAWSPDGELLAVQPAVRISCGAGARPGITCLTAGPAVYEERADGADRRQVARGVMLSGFSPEGRLVLRTAKGASYVELDPRSGRERTAISSRQVAAAAHASRALLEGLAYSADGRYQAVLARLPGDHGVGISAIAIATRHDSIVRLITSTNEISMFAWSPVGEELAYTTSGLPTPHELYVLRSPRARRWRILSQVEHFDWVTWSPDARWLLIDNEHHGEWELLHLLGLRQAPFLGGASVPTRRLPRLGGMPLWCCPQDHYAQGGGE